MPRWFSSQPGIGELGRGDGVAADDLEDQAEVHRRGKRQPRAPDHRRDEQRHHDPDDGGAPLHEAPEESGPIVREQQRREDAGHEEDERVQQGEDAEAPGRLAEQIGRQSRRDRSRRPRRRVGGHEGDVLVHAEAPHVSRKNASTCRACRRMSNLSRARCRPAARMAASRSAGAAISSDTARANASGARSATRTPVSGESASRLPWMSVATGTAPHAIASNSTRDSPSVFSCDPLTSTSAAWSHRSISDCCGSTRTFSATSRARARRPISSMIAGGSGVPMISRSGRRAGGCAAASAPIASTTSSTPLACLDLPDEHQHETVCGKVQRAAQRRAVVRGAKALHVGAVEDRPIAGRDSLPGEETPAGGLGDADHPVGESLQDRVEVVPGGEADEPDHPGRRAELGETAGESVARCVGRDDVDGPFAQQGADAAARPPDITRGTGLDMMQRNVLDRTFESGEMIAQLSRRGTDRHRLDHRAVEVLDEQHHAALPAHPQVRMVAHERHTDRRHPRRITTRPISSRPPSRPSAGHSPRRIPWAVARSPAPRRMRPTAGR